MTPEEARQIEAAAAAEIEAAVEAAYVQVVSDIRRGTAPRDAVQAAMASFEGVMASEMAAGLSALLQETVGGTQAMAIVVGGVTLSRRLYAEAATVSNEVQGIVQRHVAGVQDARRLALELFEGYRFREPDAEPLQFNRNNEKLPRYLREALLTDDAVAADLSRAYAKVQVSGLSTPALRAAYTQLLEAIDRMEAGSGDALLTKRIEIAFFERMRYFATRIAKTELHRAYAQREARLLLADADLDFVQIRRAPGRAQPCICVLFTGRDLYGLGPGVYPKANAPLPPYHPFCRCIMAPRFDLTGRTPRPMDEGGDAYFLRRLGEGVAGRVMGSRSKADEVLSRGVPAVVVVNRGRDPLYHVKTAA